MLGNQEVVVKNLGPQLSRLPGLAGMTLLASGAVALIYNPVALATLYGESARAGRRRRAMRWRPAAGRPGRTPAEAPAQVAPLVLVVDDSLTVRRVTQRLLVREGYRVSCAKDGLDALERLAEEVPSVVLSDIEMPRMDGFDLVAQHPRRRALARLPIIMITSRIAQKHRDHAAELGVDHYLGKPYSEEDLLRAGRPLHGGRARPTRLSRASGQAAALAPRGLDHRVALQRLLARLGVVDDRQRVVAAELDARRLQLDRPRLPRRVDQLVAAARPAAAGSGG